MRATIDSTRCTGCGICEIVCPEVFRMNGAGTKPSAAVHREFVPEEAVLFCRDARDCCKAKAIHLVMDAPAVERK